MINANDPKCTYGNYAEVTDDMLKMQDHIVGEINGLLYRARVCGMSFTVTDAPDGGELRMGGTLPVVDVYRRKL